MKHLYPLSSEHIDYSVWAVSCPTQSKRLVVAHWGKKNRVIITTCYIQYCFYCSCLFAELQHGERAREACPRHDVPWPHEGGLLPLRSGRENPAHPVRLSWRERLVPVLGQPGRAQEPDGHGRASPGSPGLPQREVGSGECESAIDLCAYMQMHKVAEFVGYAACMTKETLEVAEAVVKGKLRLASTAQSPCKSQVPKAEARRGRQANRALRTRRDRERWCSVWLVSQDRHQLGE